MYRLWGRCWQGGGGPNRDRRCVSAMGVLAGGWGPEPGQAVCIGYGVGAGRGVGARTGTGRVVYWLWVLFSLCVLHAADDFVSVGYGRLVGRVECQGFV